MVVEAQSIPNIVGLEDGLFTQTLLQQLLASHFLLLLGMEAMGLLEHRQMEVTQEFSVVVRH